jgi:hypothetical protein
LAHRTIVSHLQPATKEAEDYPQKVCEIKRTPNQQQSSDVPWNQLEAPKNLQIKQPISHCSWKNCPNPLVRSLHQSFPLDPVPSPSCTKW